jgi:hypothetical protein
MTNNLTEAVRRIRQLQQDVERLQSGGGDGEIRELRDIDEIVDSADLIVLGPDSLSDETTASADETAVGPDASINEATASADAATVAQVRKATAVKYDQTTYNSDGYS